MLPDDDFFLFGVPMTLALLLTAACFCLVSIAWTVILTPILFCTSPCWYWLVKQDRLALRDVYDLWVVVGAFTYGTFTAIFE